MDLGFKMNWSIVWVGNHGAVGGYPQDAGVLVVLVKFDMFIMGFKQPMTND